MGKNDKWTHAELVGLVDVLEEANQRLKNDLDLYESTIRSTIYIAWAEGVIIAALVLALIL